MATTVKLHGFLGKKYGKTFKMSVNTPAQAIGLLKANFKEFEKDVVNFNGGYRVHVGKETITDKELVALSGEKTIHIIPVVAGSGRGVGQIIIGALLIIGGGLMAPINPYIGAAMIKMGWGMIIGGVIQLLFPVAKSQQFSSEKADNKPSFTFNGPINTTGQGNCVPVLYGELLVGSQVISAGLSTRQIA